MKDFNITLHYHFYEDIYDYTVSVSSSDVVSYMPEQISYKDKTRERWLGYSQAVNDADLISEYIEDDGFIEWLADAYEEEAKEEYNLSKEELL